MKIIILLILLTIFTSNILRKVNKRHRKSHSHGNELKLGQICLKNGRRKQCKEGLVCSPDIDKQGIVVDAYKRRCVQG